MKRRILTAAMVLISCAGSAMAAETMVYVSARGKAFHKTMECSALARSKGKFQGERSRAERVGLKECGRCWRNGGAKQSQDPKSESLELDRPQMQWEKEALQ